MVTGRGAGHHMFRSAGEAGEYGVDIKIQVCLHVPRSYRPAEKVNIVQCVDKPCGIVQILKIGRAIGIRIQIHHAGGSAACSKVDPGTGKFQFQARFLPIQHNVPPESGNRIFDQWARKKQAAVITDFPAIFLYEVDDRL